MARTGQRYIEAQIVGMPKEVTAAEAVGNVIRLQGISAHTDDGWKTKLSGSSRHGERTLKGCGDPRVEAALPKYIPQQTSSSHSRVVTTWPACIR